jgi:acyl-CoA thioester hydrolase
MIKNHTYHYPCTIEFEDIDSYSIAHHSKLINLLERARVHFFSDCKLSVNDGKLNLVMVSMEVKFLKPAKLLDNLTVELRIESLKSASLIWDYTIKEGDHILLNSKVKQASVDIKTMKPCRFAPEYVSALEKILLI